MPLELSLGNEKWGLSARRLWEHTEFGQVNVGTREISTRPELNAAEDFIDLTEVFANSHNLLGYTLADLQTQNIRKPGLSACPSIGSALLATDSVQGFVKSVQRHLNLCAMRLATRNQHGDFLPVGKPDDLFGVPGIHSKLKQLLGAMGIAKSGGDQWLKTIDNFRKKGLKEEELEYAGIQPELMALNDGEQMAAAELAGLCNFKSIRLSVIPLIDAAKRQLVFCNPGERKLKKTKRLPPAQVGQIRTVLETDPILGYRVEKVEHSALWNGDQNWQAVTHDGDVIAGQNGVKLFPTVAAAEAAASAHAQRRYPKRLALGKWSRFAWNGGQDYREWLITLPWHPMSFFSGHFVLRNILVHVRCDLREGPEGERILLLHEVQSDWAQIARRRISEGKISALDRGCPPFLKEWTALAMKLVLLHSAQHGLDGVAWTKGSHQAERYKGLGATGLANLYDKTLPADVNRLLKPYGVQCESLGVFVPRNFSVKQTEQGYEVRTAENDYLGVAPTLEDARHLIPDGGHELLYEVHGVRLSESARKEILADGFFAWG